MMRAIRLSVFLKPWPCLIATFILLFTASTRALETPSAMERRIPSRLRLTFLDSSTNVNVNLFFTDWAWQRRMYSVQDHHRSPKR